MSSHFTTIALKLREVANLFDALGADPSVAIPLTTEAPPAADPVPAKRGRPAKTETASASPVLLAKDTPKVDDTKVSADHPLRAELKSLCGKLIAATDKPTTQAAVKLFGANTNEVRDVELQAACDHIAALLKKRQSDNSDV